MRFLKILASFVTLSLIVLGACSVAKAGPITSKYTQNDIKPSGQGVPDCSGSPPCAQAFGPFTVAILLNGVSENFSFTPIETQQVTTPNPPPPVFLDALPLDSSSAADPTNVLSLKPGETLAFTFNNLSGAGFQSLLGSSNFGVLDCGINAHFPNPSSGKLQGVIFVFPGTIPVTNACTDPNAPSGASLFATETVNSLDKSISLTFAPGAKIPAQFAFSFPNDDFRGCLSSPKSSCFPDLPTGITIQSGPVSTPEPASAALLALGLGGLGWWKRRKRAA